MSQPEASTHGGERCDAALTHPSSQVHASPLMFDIDQDGVQDVLVATYDGDVLFFRDSGELMAQRLTVPRLTVRR